MPISSLQPKTGVTSYTVTGGTAQSLQLLSTSSDTIEFGFTNDTNINTRRRLIFKTKRQKVSANAPNGYTQARESVTFIKPKTLANGKVTDLGATLEFHQDIEATATDIQEIIDVIAQVVIDANTAAFFKQQSLG